VVLISDRFSRGAKGPRRGTCIGERERGGARGRRWAPWSHVPGSRPGLARVGVITAATAAAAILAVAVAGCGSAGPAAAASQPEPAKGVKDLAYRAAVAAATRPGVPPGQWVYWQETTATVLRGVRQATTQQVWTTADLARAAYMDEGQVRFLCPTSATPHCRMIEQPQVVSGRDGYVVGVAYHIGPVPVGYARLSSLPRNPLALDRYLATVPVTGQPSAPDREFVIIEDLLTSYVMPSALTAEFYRALAYIPGVTVSDHLVDAAGRRGLGFQFSDLGFPVPDVVDQIVIAPATYTLMGYQALRDGRFWHGTAVLASAAVAGPGVQPDNSQL
jgi:hypothetical protein